MRRACFVYSGLFPDRLDVPGVVFAPVLRGVVFDARGVAAPPERRLTCFVRAMTVKGNREVGEELGRIDGAPSAPAAGLDWQRRSSDCCRDYPEMPTENSTEATRPKMV